MEKLREQYSLLNKRLKTHTTIEIQSIIDFIKNELPKFRQLNIIYIGLVVFFALVLGVIYAKCGCSVGYILTIEIYLLICVVLCCYCLKIIAKIDFDTKHLEVVDALYRKAFEVRKIYRYYRFAVYGFWLILFYLTYREYSVISPEYHNLFIFSIVLNIIGLSVGTIRYYKFDKNASRLLEELMVLKGLLI